MKRLFVDANVFLDAILERTPQFRYAERLLTEAAAKEVFVYTSSSLLLTVMYFLKKEGAMPMNVLIETTNGLLNVVSLVNPTEKTFRQGVYAGFTDLEDAVQYYTALQISDLDYFVTNNKKDYKKATNLLPVITPTEFFNL